MLHAPICTPGAFGIQETPEHGKVLERECLGAAGGRQARPGEPGGRKRGRNPRSAKVICQGLALLGEGRADKPEKGRLLDTQFGKARVKLPPENSGVNRRWGRKRLGREVKKT